MNNKRGNKIVFYFLACCLALVASACLSTLLYLVFHKRLSEVGLAKYCDSYCEKNHSRWFKMLGGLANLPFIMTALISPLVLEYATISGWESSTAYYIAPNGRYTKIRFAAWEESNILRVPALGAPGPKLVFISNRGARTRHAAIEVEFYYPQNPEEFAKIPTALRFLGFPRAYDPPEIKDFMRRFMSFIVESNDNILYNLGDIVAADNDELSEKFRKRFDGILTNQPPLFGIRAKVRSVRIEEF